MPTAESVTKSPSTKPICIGAAWWCSDRDAGRYQTGYGNRPSIYIKPHEHAPSLLDWSKRHRFDFLMLVDADGCHPKNQGAVTSADGDRTSVRGVWGDDNERPGNAIIREARSLTTDLRVFMGAVPYTPRVITGNALLDAAEALRDEARVAVEFADRLRLGARPAIDTGGWHCSREGRSPTKTLLENPLVRPVVDVEGWCNGMMEWPGTIWLGPDEMVTMARLKQLNVTCAGLWLQGSKEYQREQFEHWRGLGVRTFALEPTIFGDEWDALFDSTGTKA
ncbi:MAG: hypothetical protein ACKVW3_13085 [Phycisphaerales bacterium]